MQGRSVIIVCPVACEGVSKTDGNDEVGSHRIGLFPQTVILPQLGGWREK